MRRASTRKKSEEYKSVNLMARRVQKREAVQEEVQEGASTAEGSSVQEQAEERRSIARGFIFFLLFLLFVVAALFGPMMYHRWQASKEHATNQYHGFDFTAVPRGDTTFWVTQLDVKGQLYNIPFYYHPRDTERVILQKGVLKRFLDPAQKPPLITITVPRDGGSHPVVAGVEISRLTGFKYGLLDIETRSALQEPARAGLETPVVTCADASANMTVLSFDPGSQDLIVQDKKNPYCIHLFYENVTDDNSQNASDDSIRVADRFAYGLLQIMPG